MRSADPGRWNGVVDAANLVHANYAAVAACREAAIKSKKEQRCAITVTQGE